MPDHATAPLGRNFSRLLSASVLTNLGDGLMTVAVVWLASTLTRDATLIALVGLCSRLPWLVFSLPAGVITDRYDRRTLVASMDAVRAVVIGAFAAVVALIQGGLPAPEALASGAAQPPENGVWLLSLLCLVALALGFAEVIRDNSAQTLMASVVDKSRLEAANGRLWAVETATNSLIGPPLGGVLVAVALALPFALNAGFLAVGALLVASLVGTFTPRGEAAHDRRGWRAELAEGFGWLWHHSLLRTLALLLGAMNLLNAMTMAVLVLFVQDVLGLFDGWQFGLAITGFAVGASVGGLVAERIGGRLGPGVALVVAVAGMGIGEGMLGLSVSPVMFWLVSAASGVFVMLWNVVTVSLRQRIIPDRLLGRVNSAYRFFGWGSISVGALLGGLVVSWTEPILGRELALRLPFILSGGVTLLLLGVVARTLTTPRIRAAEGEAAAPQV